MTMEVETARKSLIERVEEGRRISDATFAIVRPEAVYERPIAERHRIIFYIGHLEVFDWNLLTSSLFNHTPLDRNFESLFAFGIDPVDGGLPSDVPSDWPSIEEVRRHVSLVRSTIDEQLARIDEGPDEHVQLILNVAIEHRLMHAETLAYMFHGLPLEAKVALTTSVELRDSPKVKQQTVDIPDGMATLGLKRDSAFGWDNEFEQLKVHVPAFAIDKFKVTNGMFLEFVRAEGYENRSLWSREDWEWKERWSVRHPRFWVPNGDGWKCRTMFDEVALPMDWPVYVSHAEAAAYARWSGRALPSEAQWHRAACGSGDGSERLYPWGNSPPSSGHGNFDFQNWDPVSTGAHPQGESAFGVADMVGNGWEWTSSEFAPFEGFKPFPFYPGYSANFFDGKHFVMKGGSARTAACMLRRSFRNWFQPHYPHIYAGFRCVTHR